MLVIPFSSPMALLPKVGHGPLILGVFLDHKQGRTTIGKTLLDEWSARRRDVYLTTHNTPNRQKSMPPVGFELTISAGERPQTYTLDGADTETGCNTITTRYINPYPANVENIVNS
jgi:hypothetical protein